MIENWTAPLIIPTLEPGVVHVWSIDLADPDSPQLLSHAHTCLSLPEQQRAERLRQGTTRDEFIAGRGCLRALLAHYLHRSPSSLVLQVGSSGKPFLALSAAPSFNVAHSGGLVLIALSPEGNLGIDVEEIDPRVEALELAEDHFTESEFATIAGAGPNRLASFYRCWTRKEAVTKADGRGLGLALKSFRVGAEPVPERVVTLPNNENGEKLELFLEDLPVPSRFAAALASSLPITSAQLLRTNSLAVFHASPIQHKGTSVRKLDADPGFSNRFRLPIGASV